VGHGEEAPESLLANPLNFRIHPKPQQDALTGGLNALGWIAEVLVNRRSQTVIDGHLRVELAISRGEPTVPVTYVDLSPEEERLALLTLDPISAMAGQDAAKLGELLAEVEAQEPGLQAMLDELARGAGIGMGGVVPEDPGAEVDQADELREKWGTERGQLWELGAHRLVCGDATSEQDVKLLLDGKIPRLCVTDPPYGVDYDPAWRNEAAANGHLAYAPSRVGEVSNDDRSDWTDAYRLAPGPVIYCWAPAGPNSIEFYSGLIAAGFQVRMQMIWAKSNFPISRGHYHIRHEPCWYAVRKGQTAGWIGDRTQTTLWEINLDHNVEGGHSTQKPLECMARPIRNHEGDVYDPFLGSGTTLVACEQLGRRGFAMEIEPKYVAVALERLAKMGLEPKLLTAVP